MRFKNDTFETKEKKNYSRTKFTVEFTVIEKSVEFILFIAYDDKRDGLPLSDSRSVSIRVSRVSRASKDCGGRS